MIRLKIKLLSKLFKPIRLFDLTAKLKSKISKVYDISLQRYRDEKIHEEWIISILGLKKYDCISYFVSHKICLNF